MIFMPEKISFHHRKKEWLGAIFTHTSGRSSSNLFIGVNLVGIFSSFIGVVPSHSIFLFSGNVGIGT
mgnify:CR=1 FL=1|jgi:hypothetical protein|tara:strand:- start:212 stop:412 length:201 start_codon:yes stop_codon:yes gene_type:complete